MKIELDFAELHNPLFLNGCNLQMKLQPKGREGLSLVYDREEKELLVYFKEKMAIVPSSNVSSMTPKVVEKYLDLKTLKTIIPPPNPVTAQVKPDLKKEEANLSRAVTTNKAGVPLKAFPNKSAQVGGPSDHVFSDGPGKVRD